MKLPLVEEVRDARARAEESSRAAMQLHRIASALTSVHIVEQQVAQRPSLDVVPPGAELVEELAEAWPQLEDLAGSGPRTSEHMAQQLAGRRAQLQLARQVLRPIANDAQARSNALHALQLQQRELIDTPEFASEVAELAAMGQERDQLATEIGPINTRLAMVEPARGLLRTFVQRLRDEEREHGGAEDPGGVLAWRTAYVAHNLVDGLGEVLEQVQMDVPLPVAPDVPARPDPADAERLWGEIASVRAVLGELSEALEAEGAKLDATRDDKQGRHDALTRQILERMG